MIDYIKGELTELAPARAVIEAAGVGYELNISLSTYDKLSVLTAENSAQSRLYVYEDVREDAWVLFGFASKKERELFIHLISVSGVGGNTARTILSSYSVNELVGIIANRQDAMLKRVKGIGGKTAQRIIVELEDKMLAAAGELDFEKAAKLRDELFALRGDKPADKPQQKRRRNKHR